MRRFFILSIAVLILSTCSNDDTVETPKPINFTASDGTAVGCVYVDFELTGNTNSVEVFRREKGTAEWQLIIGTGEPFYDFAGYWGGTGMPPGKVFEYKMRACCGDQNEFTEVDEGYAYDIIPVTSVNIISTDTTHSLSWFEGNEVTFLNDVEIRFDIFRSENIEGPFTKIATVDQDRVYFDDLEYLPDLQGKTIYYRINTWFYPYESSFVEGALITTQ